MPRVSTICWIAVSVAAIALTVGVCYLTGRPQELHIETATIAELGGAADLDFNAIEQHLEFDTCNRIVSPLGSRCRRNTERID